MYNNKKKIRVRFHYFYKTYNPIKSELNVENIFKILTNVI